MKNFFFLLPFFLNVFLFNGILNAKTSKCLQTDIVWRGNISHFQIESQTVFALNNLKPQSTNVSYLAQKIDFAKTHFEWRLSARLLFETNTSSYFRYWLLSDREDLTNALSGFFIEVKDRRLQLYQRTDGQDQVLAKSATGSLMMNPTDILLSASFKSNQLIVKYKKNGTTSEVKWADLIPGFSQPENCYAGVVCYYPSGRAKSFYFKEWLAQNGNPVIPDPGHPIELDSVQTLSETRLMVHFSERVYSSDALFLLDGVSDGISNLSHAEYTDKVELNLTIPLIAGNHELQVNNLNRENPQAKDNYCGVFSYRTGDPEEPDVSAVRVTISEIMANPDGVAGLPPVEYVELANISGSDVNLSDWKFYYGDKAFKLPDYRLKQGFCVILCGKNAFDQFDSSIPKVYIPSFPVLANTGKLLYLEDDLSRLQSVVSYTDQWYGSNKEKSGYSLERIDLFNHYSSSLNWTASEDQKGGTPGQKNSVSRDNPDNIRTGLLSCTLLQPQMLRLSFNKSMNDVYLSDPDNYGISAPFEIVSVKTNYPVSDQVDLQLSDSLASGTCLELQLLNLICVNGFQADPEQISTVCRSGSLKPNDLLINELLYYPLKDEAEFIEIYNHSDLPVDLSGLRIATRKSDGSLQYISRISESAIYAAPQQYICISKSVESIARVYETESDGLYVQVDKLPAFSNTGGRVVLLNSTDEVIDEFPFSPGLHAVSAKNQQGVSLERKSVLVSAEETNNWTSSYHPKGASPGFRNSLNIPVGDTDAEGRMFWSNQKYFRPASQGDEQFWHLSYNLQELPHKITVEVYAANGLLVRTLLRNKETGGTGEVIWDGKDDHGTTLPIAPYVVYLQYFDSKSQLRKEKWVVTLTN